MREEHSYLIKGIDPVIWRMFKIKSVEIDKPMNQILLDYIKRFAKAPAVKKKGSVAHEVQMRRKRR